MIVKVTKGNDFAFIDNEGEVLHNVKVSGNNQKIVDSLNRIINEDTFITFEGQLKMIPNELIIREHNKPPQVNKASDLYISKHLTKFLEAQGFTVEIIKE